VWLPDGTLLDTATLPAVAGLGLDAEVRIGLWLPEADRRYLPDSALLDDQARLRLGTVADLSEAGPSNGVCQ
jgi:hypothetical protein